MDEKGIGLEGIHYRMTVSEVLDCHPETAKVFVALGLRCVGCPTDKFHTLGEVAHLNHLDVHFLAGHLEQAVNRQSESP